MPYLCGVVAFRKRLEIITKKEVTIQETVFREVVFVNTVHRKPGNCGVKSWKA